MIMSRFEAATRSYRVAHVSYGVIGTSVWSITSPASTASASQMRELPVMRSPRIRTQLMGARSEEHTSELQSLAYLVCRLLLEKKKTNTDHNTPLEHASHKPPS